MIIKDLKDKYPLVYEAAMKNCNTGCNENDTISGSFTWCNTPEDHVFWSSIVSGQFDRAKKICPHLFTKSPEEFKVGDWVYAEKQDEKDYRNPEHIPVFQIKDFNDTNEYLRPVKGDSSGVHMKHCRLATQAEIDEATGVKSETMFRKGDYIVILNKPNGILDYLPPNYVYKQNRNYDCVESDVDIKGTKTSCSDVKFVNKNDWRYATSEEIAEYDRLGKPYDVTTMNMKTTSTDMKAIQAEAKRFFPIGCRFRNTDGEEYLLVDDDIVYKIINNMIYASEGLGCLYKDGTWATLISMPKTKQTYTVDELVVGEVYVESNPGWNYYYILQIGETEHSRLEIDNDSGNVKRFAYSELKSASRGCSYRKATTDEIQLLNEQIKTSTLGKAKTAWEVASPPSRPISINMVADVWPVESPKPLLLNKPTKQKQLVNLK
jgi:hypothetical protein